MPTPRATPLPLLPPAVRSSHPAFQLSHISAAGAPALATDHFTRPLVDLDDVAGRIGAVLALIAARLTGKRIPADLALTIDCARETLSDFGKLRTARARTKAFRDEHGIETLKDLSFAFVDHAAILGAGTTHTA